LLSGAIGIRLIARRLLVGFLGPVSLTIVLGLLGRRIVGFFFFVTIGVLAFGVAVLPLVRIRILFIRIEVVGTRFVAVPLLGFLRIIILIKIRFLTLFAFFTLFLILILNRIFEVIG